MKWADLKKKVLSLLNIDAFSEKDGKHSFTDEQTAKLESIEEGFAQKMIAALDAELARKNEDSAAIVELRGQLDQALQDKKDLKEEVVEKDDQIDQLADKPEKDVDPEPPGLTIFHKSKKFKINHKLFHNHAAYEYLEHGRALPVAGDTIDVDDLQTEFGAYTQQTKRDIMLSLTQKTKSMEYMTTKMAQDNWKAAHGTITSVVQQFTPKWTPLGTGRFTPLEITNRQHKINVPITPADVLHSWVAFLYDERLEPQQMPIVKYIIENLIIPKVADDRELKLIGKGDYSALDWSGVSDGDAGQATGSGMDGFCTILEDLKSAGDTDVNWLLDGVTLTSNNIIDQVNDFVDGIDEVYQGKDMKIFCDLTRYKMYKRAYRDLYGSENYSSEFSDIIDFSNNRLTPLPSMAGKAILFATPKENFIRLRHLNEGTSKIYMQAYNYDVKVFAEYWEAVGFGIKEAIFAYVPDSGSGSGSGS